MTALKNYPFVDSSSNYRIEVWVTNKRWLNTTLNLRNIIAIQDLGKED
jgi:cell surface protein SprA